MVSTIGINSFSIVHTHIQRHAECMLHAFEPLLYVLFCFSWPQDSIKFIHSFHALTLISDPAWIILASGQLHKYCVSRSLTTSLLPYSPLSHTPVLLFICFWHIFYYLFSFFILRHAKCVCECMWREIMNNTCCGFLVSETDGGDGELPLGSFFPHRTL